MRLTCTNRQRNRCEWHEPPFDESAVDLIESLNTPAFKIAAFEIVDLPLIRYAASPGKPIILSTGMASEDEIDEAVTTAREAGCKELVLLHCISAYPAPMDQANLRQMPELARRFGTIPGLSDHPLGTTASVAAVALGGCLIEKHFTLSRADKGPDSKFSLEPEDLELLWRDAKDGWLALGRAGFERQEAEAATKVFRRSIYITADLEPGDVLTAQNMRCIRPGYGLPPKNYGSLLSRRVKRPVHKGMPVSWDLFLDPGTGEP